MPSASDPNSPNIESRLQSTFGVKPSGTPSSAGKPGVQAADVSFPAPPAPASAPPGRPTGTPTPAPIVAPPAPAAPKPAAPQGAGGEMWPDARAKQGQPQQAGGEMWPDAQAPPIAPPPSVVPSVNALNQPELAITPEGAQRYRESVVRLRESLGPMPNIFRMAGMPEMPVEPGRHNYNPFTGRWSR